MINDYFSSDDLFSSFFDLSPICIWIKDLNNNLLKINQAAAALERKPAQGMEGKSCTELYTAERAHAFWCDDKAVIESGIPKLSFFELHPIPGTNASKWLQVTKLPIKNKKGVITGIMVYAIDVNDVAEAEDKTRQRELYNQHLMDVAPFPVFITSHNDNSLTYINNEAAKIFGISVFDAKNISVSSLFVDKQKQLHIHEILLNKGEIKNEEVLLKCPDGKIIHSLLSAIKINYDGFAASYIVFEDITKLKQNEQELSQIAEEFRIVFESSSDAIFWADSDTGIIINCNRSAEALLELGRKDIIGKYHWEIHPKNQAEKYKNLFADINKTHPGGMDLEVETSSGRRVPVSISVNTIDLENKRITQANIVDISERFASHKALMESEHRYRTIVSNAPLVFFELDQKGYIHLIEGKGLKSVSNLQQLVGESLKNLLNSYPEYLKQIDRALNGESVNVIMEFSKSAFSAFFSPVKSNLGKIESIIGVAVDISEQRKIEQKLSRERNILRTLIDIIPSQIFVKDKKSRFIVGNKMVSDNLNAKSPESIVGKTDFDFFPPDIARMYFDEEQAIIKNNQAILNVEKNGFIDGAEHFFEVSKIPFHNQENEVIGIVGISQNITERKKIEAAIRESESKFRLMAENMKDVIWQMTPDFRFTYLSPSFYNLLGFEPSEFIGRTIWELLSEESSVQLHSLIENVLKGSNSKKSGQSLMFEALQYHADGSLIWTEIGSNPVFEKSGELIHFQGVTRDITQRKNAEIALKASQEKLSVVIANAPVVIFQIDKEGIFLFSDGKGLESLGLKPGEVVGLSVFEVYKDYPVICTQVMEALSGKKVRGTVKVQDVYFEIQYDPLFDETGELTSMIGMAYDVSERKIAQIALEESEKRFRSLFREMTEGVAIHEIVFDENNKPLDYKILEVNPAFAKQTGLTKDPINQLASQFYDSEKAPFLEEYALVAQNGGTYNFETYFAPMERFLKISVVSPGENRFATVFEDVTIQKKHERELEDKNKELERFTYTVSHDLKSPLVTIKGFIGMLEQDLLANSEENIADDMQRIKSATDKMTNLLNDLLELSRVGRYLNPPVKVSMLSVINEAVELLSGILKEKDAELEIANNMPDVYIDKQRMVEVWLNLIENAAKFSGSNQKPKISINYTKEDTKFIFTIQDNGIGIDKKYFNVVFGLFNKLDNKSNGTGIGLALVKRIIEVHGGEVWVESDGIGKGTKISFSIPVKMVKQKQDI